MNKRIITRDELLAPKLKGLKQIAGIVKRTLGPGGLPILIERLGQNLEGGPLGPKITKDGVSVADECSSPNKEEDIIIQAVKEICKKTVNVAGDGTTTAVVLGEAIVNEMEEMLKADPKLNPQLVKDSVEEATREVIKLLNKASIPADTNEIIRQVATISANGDEHIGAIIGEAFQKVGAEGVITVDEGYTDTVTLDVVEGYQFNRGAEARNAFFNDKNKTQFEGQNVAVILYDGKLYNYLDLVPALKMLAAVDATTGRPTKKMPPVLIIANEFSNEVLTWLMIQKNEAGFEFCPVVGPNVTHVRSAYYDDLAVYTGGTRLGQASRSLAAIEPDDVGTVQRVIVDKYKTTLYEGQGAEDEILTRVDQLKVAKKGAESPYDAQILNDRIAALTQGIAKIGVGGVTDLEIREKYDRIEDALNAARAAIEEGVVPGGGVTLFKIAQRMKVKTIGQKILQIALQVPFFQILDNVGLTSAEIGQIGAALMNNKNKVFDAKSKKIKNALKAGIVDPVKVTRTALENAVSIATLLSTAGGAIIYELPPTR